MEPGRRRLAGASGAYWGWCGSFRIPTGPVPPRAFNRVSAALPGGQLADGQLCPGRHYPRGSNWFPLGVVASGTGFSHGTLRAAAVVRLFLAGIRSIHELVWAVLFVTAFGLSPLAAILAIALPYGGILGRIYADLFNDVPDPPLQALRASGASPLRVLLYGRLPMALPDLLGYTFYRLECAIRAAAIMSFVGIRGLGYEIQLSLHDLLFNQVWTLMLFMVALVMVVDMWSSRLRRSLLS